MTLPNGATPGAPPMLHVATAHDGTIYRDLNGNGQMDPYEDPRLPAAERVADLVPRLSLPEKLGLMFHTVIEMGPGGELLQDSGVFAKSSTREVVREKYISAFNIHQIPSARAAARWNNAIQALAEQTPHGIPVTISTDPRHAFTENSGVAFLSGPFSQWPDMLGLAALDDLALLEQFCGVVRQEYRAVGIRMALHPQVDVPTEPRWGRQLQTFGTDTARVRAFTRAYVRGLQGDRLGRDSVAATTKHFPGGGPQLDGEDPHFPYGREQVYPGGNFEGHLGPFVEAIEAGSSAIMPYYGMPVGLVLDAEPIEEVGFAYNRQILTGLLRERLGYQGVVLSDWELITDNHVGDLVLPARAWGVEGLTEVERVTKLVAAGVDQFGGEECVEILAAAVVSGEISVERIDESVRRILLVKFQLGLFDNPFVDEADADRVLQEPASRDAGRRAQSRSITLLTNDGVLPIRPRARVHLEGVSAFAFDDHADVVDVTDDLAQADVAVVRVPAPAEPRDDLLLESGFRQGSLDFRPGLIARLKRMASVCPLVLVVDLDRPGILTPFVEFASAIVVCFGVSDEALADGLTGRVAPAGRLPIDIPASMDAVRWADPDVGGLALDPVFASGHGLQDYEISSAAQPVAGHATQHHYSVRPHRPCPDRDEVR